VVSNANVLAPDLSSRKLELAATMYARERVWAVRISNVVDTSLEPLWISSANVRIVLQLAKTYAMTGNPWTVKFADWFLTV
jgi:hypothetical protein